jgi:hypothetical protein
MAHASRLVDHLLNDRIAAKHAHGLLPVIGPRLGLVGSSAHQKTHLFFQSRHACF